MIDIEVMVPSTILSEDWHPTEEASISFWKKIDTKLKKIPAYLDV